MRGLINQFPAIDRFFPVFGRAPRRGNRSRARFSDDAFEPQFAVGFAVTSRSNPVASKSITLTCAPGASATVSFVVKNTGSQPIEDLRVSLHSRLDFAIATHLPLPSRLLAGQTAEVRYEVRAPMQINPSCDYNRVAYGHCSVLYSRAGRAHLAHSTLKIQLKSPQAAVPGQAD